MNLKKLQDKIAEIYFHHGLFCASHSYSILLICIGIILFVCYPLTKLPLPGNAPLEHVTPVRDYVVPSKHSSEESIRPVWFQDSPLGYIQQFVVKAAVSPWHPKRHIPIDAFRAALSTVFDVTDKLNNFQLKNGSQTVTVSDLCVRVSESLPDKHLKNVLQEYGCFIVSPANLWQKDVNIFKADSKIIKTIYKSYGSGDDVLLPKDILFGLPWIETGISKYFLRNKQRVISYAVTLVFKTYDGRFTEQLKDSLHAKFPLSKTTSNNTQDDIVHIHFQGVASNYFVEYNMVIVTYLVLFLYIYFSVRKIEMVKSKSGLAVSAVLTVISSLLMSISICTFFGLTPSVNRGEIFPYLVIVIGLENVIVLTKSVVSTPLHYDVKIRVAQGLSKEGWSITKNLLAELAILFIGFFTFVPAIQEFCLFACVGLLTDFFLQMVFFATTLSIDIRRMELSDLQKQNLQEGIQQENINPNLPLTPPSYCPVISQLTGGPPSSAMIHNSYSSSSRLPSTPYTPYTPNAMSPPPSPGGHGYSDDSFQSPTIVKARRLKMMYFWARTRVVQRLIMVCTVIWIILIVYKAGLFHHLADKAQNSMYLDKFLPKYSKDSPYGTTEYITSYETGSRWSSDDISTLLYHHDTDSFTKLSYKHWPTLFGYYNISLNARYVSILPTIHLSIPVSPEYTVQIRHPSEQASIRDPDHPNEDIQHPYGSENVDKGTNYPYSGFEFFVTVLLLLLSVIVIVYAMMMLYRCMCSKRYAKWRTSWNKVKRKNRSQYKKQIQESLPLLLRGHAQEVECISSDGSLVVSSCLGGQIRVWDLNTGECLTAIYRKCATPPLQRKPCVGRNVNDSDAELYAEYHEIRERNSPKTNFTKNTVESKLSSSLLYQRRKNRFENVPDLSSTIQTKFYSLLNKDGDQETNRQTEENKSGGHVENDTEIDRNRTGTEMVIQNSSHGFDFSSKFESVYNEHKNLMEESENYQRHKASVREAARKEATYSAGDASIRKVKEGQGHFIEDNTPAIWCVTSDSGLIIAGCGNGRVEFWDAHTGALKCLYEEIKVGVTHICFYAKKNLVIAARLDGSIDFLELETFITHATPPSTTPPRGFMSRSPSMPHDNIHCILLQSLQAHQQPINSLQMEGGRVVTASQDHTLKVFRLEDSMCLYTLYGHTGGVTALYLDKMAPLAAASGSEDGSVRLWDLLTGACVHKMCGHSSSITALTCTEVYVISTAMNDKLCIWERCRGQLLHSIQVEPGYCNTIAMLTSKLLVSGGQGCLLLWDVSKGDILRSIPLGDRDYSVFVRQVLVVSHSVVVCDYGMELRIVQFPSVLEKVD